MWENPEVLALKDLIEKKFKVIKLIFVLGVSTQALSILYPSILSVCPRPSVPG